jgi:hypothetical protein
VGFILLIIDLFRGDVVTMNLSIFCMTILLTLALRSGWVQQKINNFPDIQITKLFSDDLNVRRRPNEGVYRCAKNGLTVGLVFALVSLPVLILVRVILHKQYVFEPSILIFGELFLASIIFAYYGINPCARHFILRTLLMRNRLAPFDYEKFLDYAASLIFLRKVGGGYEFIHGMILDYFASLEADNVIQ